MVDASLNIDNMLHNSPIKDAQEWAVHDYEYCGELSKITNLKELKSIQEAFDKISAEGYQWEIFTEFCEHQGYILELPSVDIFTKSYARAYDSLEEWAKQILESAGELENIPQYLNSYFDISAYTRDLQLNGDVFSIKTHTNTHVFWNI